MCVVVHWNERVCVWAFAKCKWIQSFLSVDFGHQKYTRSACASSNESLFYLSISNLSVRWNKQFWYGASTEWRQVQRNTIACSWEFQQFSATKNICFRKQQSFPSTKACLIWSRENVMKQHRMLACNHHGGQIFGPKSDTAMLRGCCYWFENVHVCTLVLRYSLHMHIYDLFWPISCRSFIPITTLNNQCTK